MSLKSVQLPSALSFVRKLCDIVTIVTNGLNLLIYRNFHLAQTFVTTLNRLEFFVTNFQAPFLCHKVFEVCDKFVTRFVTNSNGSKLPLFPNDSLIFQTSCHNVTKFWNKNGKWKGNRGQPKNFS